jgi:hypothetical protein
VQENQLCVVRQVVVMELVVTPGLVHDEDLADADLLKNGDDDDAMELALPPSA